MQERALPVHVYAPAILTIIVLRDVIAIRELEVCVVASGLVGPDAGSAQLEIEQSGHEERIVAYELGFQTSRVLGGQPAVLRIQVQQFAAQAGGLLVSPRC